MSAQVVGRPGPFSSAGVDAVPPELGLHNTVILVGCSQTKRQDLPGGQGPLFDLYDGPVWRTLRSRLGNWRRVGAHVVVLSGKFGVVDARATAQPYEARLTPERAERLMEDGLLRGNDCFDSLSDPAWGGRSPLEAMAPPATNGPWSGALVCASSEYRRVFTALLEEMRQQRLLAADAPVLVSRGFIGQQRSQLGHWVQVLQGQTPVDGERSDQALEADLDVATAGRDGNGCHESSQGT